MIFQNDQHYYYLCQSVEGNQPVIELYRGPGDANGGKQPELISKQKLTLSAHEPLRLKIQAAGNSYAFYYATQSNRWKLLKDNVPADILSTHTAGGFVGCMYAMYVTSSGAPSANTAAFTSFESKGNDK